MIDKKKTEEEILSDLIYFHARFNDIWHFDPHKDNDWPNDSECIVIIADDKEEITSGFYSECKFYLNSGFPDDCFDQSNKCVYAWCYLSDFIQMLDKGVKHESKIYR